MSAGQQHKECTRWMGVRNEIPPQTSGMKGFLGDQHCRHSCSFSTFPWFLPLQQLWWRLQIIPLLQTFLFRDLLLRTKPIPVCQLLSLTPEVCFWPELIPNLCGPASQVFVQLGEKEARSLWKLPSFMWETWLGEIGSSWWLVLCSSCAKVSTGGKWMSCSCLLISLGMFFHLCPFSSAPFCGVCLKGFS